MGVIESRPYDEIVREVPQAGFFYNPLYLKYEANCYSGTNRSTTFFFSNSKLFCPVIASPSQIGTGVPSTMPAPVYKGPENKKTISALYRNYVDYMDAFNLPVSLRIDPCYSLPDVGFKTLMSMGFLPTPHFTSLVDLEIAENELWQRLRKRYRSLINSVTKKHTIVNSEEVGRPIHLFQQWKRLYSEVTARADAVPNDVTFAAMEAMYKAGVTLIVAAMDEKQKMLSAVELGYSVLSAYYLHGATIPDLEGGEPFAHALLWTSILFLKSCGRKFFEIGPIDYNFPGTCESPSKKMLTISQFKLGMGGKLVPFINLQRPAGQKG